MARTVTAMAMATAMAAPVTAAASPTRSACGKAGPRLADLSNRKQSLPVVLAYSSANTAEKAEFVQLWRNPDTSEKTLLYFVRKHNGEDRARKLAKSFADEASTILCENAPECEARAMLKELVEFVLNRKS